ncbi:glutathione peroxidase [Methylosinus sp. H3A]|uniref:glutathione peroxidase n=1 Tax=Methylosinus sp. H3A TaxID=2785786 RepID=UPI0018C217B1|nr:glutathione peroxidase [Methylosinus sp. H3A]MBG0808706.1 glutathione peroxidase [Methylosinus sp. H3A]
MSELYDIEARTIDGETVKIGDYAGKVILIVNVASRCGFTLQYNGLEAIWNENRDKGFVILGFPCNQFSNQEPGTDEEIKTFCSTRFIVTFPLFSKIEVNGENQHPLYKLLKEKDPGPAEDVKWNFTKFLIDRKGNVVKRFQATNTPRQMEPDIHALLAAEA